MKEQKKILFCIDSFNGGGAERVLYEILSNIDRDKFDVDLIVIHCAGQLVDEFKNWGNFRTVLPKLHQENKDPIYYRVFNFFIDNIWKPCVFHWPNLMISQKYDYVVAYLESESTLFCSNIRLRKSGKKYAWIHCDIANAEHWLNTVYRSRSVQCATYQKYDRILCVSKSVKDSVVHRITGITENKILVLYNPVNEIKIRNMASQKNDFQWECDVKLISIGRLDRHKNMARAIFVVDAMKKIGISSELIILGEGSERKSLEKLIQEYGLSDCIHLMGFQNNPYKFLNSADIYLCTSDVEGFSTTATEALILGKPIVTTPCAGMDEIISNINCGIISTFDPSDIAKAVMKVYENKTFYSQMARLRGDSFRLSERMKQIESLFS